MVLKVIKMKRNTLLKTGIIGSILALICCLTPVLLITLGAMGLITMTIYIDYVIWPLFGFFLLITVYALLIKNQT